MFKKFILMLIVTFTLQLSWTVASAYCLHETDKTSQHFGHHPHQHQQSQQENQEADHVDQKKSGAKKSSTHPDCASCTHASSAFATFHVELMHLAPQIYQVNLSQLQTPIPFLGKPERPKWQAAA